MVQILTLFSRLSHRACISSGRTSPELPRSENSVERIPRDQPRESTCVEKPVQSRARSFFRCAAPRATRTLHARSGGSTRRNQSGEQQERFALAQERRQLGLSYASGSPSGRCSRNRRRCRPPELRALSRPPDSGVRRVVRKVEPATGGPARNCHSDLPDEERVLLRHRMPRCPPTPDAPYPARESACRVSIWDCAATTFQAVPPDFSA